MPGVPYQPDPRRDKYTNETIRQMCAYISCNAKIARYVGVPEGYVIGVRRRLSANEDCNKEAMPYGGRLVDDPNEPSGNGEQRKWATRAEDANARFVAALGRVL